MKSSLLVALSAALILFSCSNSHPSSQAETKKQSADDHKSAPDFKLKDAEGREVKLSDYRGKVVLLNFWATWCGPCQLEIPWFIDFEKQYRSRGFEVLGVSMDEDGWKAVRPYVAAHQVNYPILLGNDIVTQLYGGVDSLPTTFMIGRDGKISKVHVGLAGRNEYLSEIKSLLGT